MDVPYHRKQNKKNNFKHYLHLFIKTQTNGYCNSSGKNLFVFEQTLNFFDFLNNKFLRLYQLNFLYTLLKKPYLPIMLDPSYSDQLFFKPTSEAHSLCLNSYLQLHNMITMDAVSGEQAWWVLMKNDVKKIR